MEERKLNDFLPEINNLQTRNIKLLAVDQSNIKTQSSEIEKDLFFIPEQRIKQNVE